MLVRQQQEKWLGSAPTFPGNQHFLLPFLPVLNQHWFETDADTQAK